MNWSKILSNKNLLIFQEYGKRIVEELLEEYSNQGIIFEHYKECYGRYYINYIRFKYILLLNTRWSGEISIPNKILINKWTNKIMCGSNKFHQPKLNYEKFAGEVKSHFRNVIKQFIEAEKEIKKEQIKNKLENIEKDFIE